MPTSLESLYSTQSALRTSGGALTAEELEKMGIEVKQPGEDLGLDFTDYLQLMIQQLQNQTIDNATDTTDMLNQLVQMSVVQMMSTVQTTIETLVDASTLSYAASLVGKTVTVAKYDDEGNLQEVVGTVTGTGSYQNTPVIFVDGEMYALSDIMAVGTLPELPETPPETGEGGDGSSDGGQETPAP